MTIITLPACEENSRKLQTAVNLDKFTSMIFDSLTWASIFTPSAIKQLPMVACYCYLLAINFYLLAILAVRVTLKVEELCEFMGCRVLL